MKTCSKCHCSKPLSEFHLCSRRADNRANYCKLCACRVKRARYWENLEQEKEYNAEYHKQNKEQIRARKREHAKNNRPAINKRRKREYHSKYNSDPLYKLTLLLRSRVMGALTGKDKSAKTKELLGAPWVWVEAYLEELFQPGMSWENHGPVWHIDHIRPCASFGLRDPEQQKMCFHWTNLQPLFALDNLRKSDTYDPQNA